MIIIVFTQRPKCWNRHPHGQKTHPRSQDPRAPARGLFAPSSRAGHRRVVLDAGVFRCARPGPSEVRDATPGAKRGAKREPVSSQLRLLASFVLSSPNRLPARRSAGSDATEARTEESPQTHCRSAGLRAPGTAGRSLATCGGGGFAGQREIRHHRSPTQYRARLDAQSKKTAVNETVLDALAPREWTARYEQLRGDALNQGSGVSTGI